MRVWEAVVAEIERSSHHVKAIYGHVPPTGAVNFGDQAVRVQAAKGTPDLRTSLSGISPARSQNETSIEVVRGCRSTSQFKLRKGLALRVPRDGPFETLFSKPLASQIEHEQ